MSESSPLHISASSLSTFKQCPVKWKFQYIDRRRGRASMSMVMGTFAHAVLEELFNWDPEYRTIEFAKEIARYEWDKLCATDKEFASLHLTPALKKEFRIRAWAFIEGLWELENPQAVDVVETERGFEIEYHGALVRGYIDRVSRGETGLIVDDYKSGKPPSARYRADKMAQVHLYALMASQLYEEPVESVGLLHIGQQKEVIRVEVDKKLLEKTAKKLEKAIDVIGEAKATENFVPKTSPLCGWCDFVRECSAGQGQIKEAIRFGRQRMDAPAVAALGLLPQR